MPADHASRYERDASASATSAKNGMREGKRTSQSGRKRDKRVATGASPHTHLLNESFIALTCSDSYEVCTYALNMYSTFSTDI